MQIRGRWRERHLAAFGVAAGALLAVWGFAIEPRWLDIREVAAEAPNLPAWMEGRRIALLGDFQIGMRFGNTGTVRRAISRIIQERPMAVLLTGDFVYEALVNPGPALRTLSELLRPLAQHQLPAYAVLGNHDYGEEGSRFARLHLASEVRRTLEEAGVCVLENEAVLLQEGLYVIGCASHQRYDNGAAAALAQVPRDAPRLVLMHNPRSFAPLPAGSAPIALAGHTHGGQIRTPFKPALTLGRFTMPWPLYLDGWIEGYGKPGNHLFVNRGIGFSRLPIRIGCPPELTLLTLHAPARRA